MRMPGCVNLLLVAVVARPIVRSLLYNEGSTVPRKKYRVFMQITNSRKKQLITHMCCKLRNFFGIGLFQVPKKVCTEI